MNDAPQEPHPLPKPEILGSRRWHVSLIWLVPLIAALAGLALVVRTVLREGPVITITFQTAEGLEAGKTEVHYKNVVVGKVDSIVLSNDHQQVLVTVRLSKNAEGLAVQDTRFWVERPRIGVGGVSGINTLLSGAYIGVDIGTSQQPQRYFTGLEKPPAVTHDEHGRRFVLHGDDAGSLIIGAPVYFRRLPVGRVAALDLDPDSRGVTVQIFIDSPYGDFVTTNTHFWNSSGLDLSVNANGLKLNAQSIATVIAGGIAFQDLSPDHPSPPAPDKAEFHLYDDQTSALAPPDGAAITALMQFHQSTRGLSVGAPVVFQGVTLGSVASMDLQYDAHHRRFYTDVVAILYPERLGPAYATLKQSSNGSSQAILQQLVDQGLRAQMQPGNIITGQIFIALNLMPGAKSDASAGTDARLRIPTLTGGFEQLQKQIQDIVAKLDAIPFEQIGNNLRDTLASANDLLKQLDKDIAPEARKTLESAHQAIQSLNDSLASPEAPLQQDVHKTLDQVNRAAYSMRALADYLQQHPESLIRGKSDGNEPAGNSGHDSAGTPSP